MLSIVINKFEGRGLASFTTHFLIVENTIFSKLYYGLWMIKSKDQKEKLIF